MPKVTIHENCNTLSVQYDVRTAGQRTNVANELHATPSQFTLNESLKRAVLQFDGLHGCRSLSWGKVVNHSASTRTFKRLACSL